MKETNAEASWKYAFFIFGEGFKSSQDLNYNNHEI